MSARLAAVIRLALLSIALFSVDTLAVENVRYVLDYSDSRVRILTGKAGFLSALGHRHVIRVARLHGQLQAGTYVRGKGAFSLWFDVRELILDEKTDRQTAGKAFSRPPSQRAIEKTRANMLGAEVFAADVFPKVRMSGNARRLKDGGWVLETTVFVRDDWLPVLLYPQVSNQQGRLIVSGKIALTQSALGIKPFSAALGGIAVADEIEIRYRVVFVAAAGANQAAMDMLQD